LPGLLDIACEDEPHGVACHAANNTDPGLPQDLVASEEFISEPSGLDGRREGIVIDGCHSFLDHRSQRADGRGLSLDGQNGQQGIGIIGPAGIALCQVDRRVAAPVLLQPLLLGTSITTRLFGVY
jgi:hypothetical protein